MIDVAPKYRRKFKVTEKVPKYLVGTHRLRINGVIRHPGETITGEIPQFYIDNGHVTPVKGD